MKENNNTISINPKEDVIKNAKDLLEKAELWTLVRTDEKGFVHVHADNQVNFLALMLCVFKEQPELKEDLDMMLMMEAQREG